MTEEDVTTAGEEMTGEDVTTAGEEMTGEDVTTAGEEMTGEDVTTANHDVMNVIKARMPKMVPMIGLVLSVTILTSHSAENVISVVKRRAAVGKGRRKPGPKERGINAVGIT